MASAAQLLAYAERRERVAYFHGEYASRWSDEEAHHRDQGLAETAESFALMVRAAESNRERALKQAHDARCQALTTQQPASQTLVSGEEAGAGESLSRREI